ncbi:MAG TPA: FAD-dependent oxidoreductase [Pyrinomonadaceae bacterium]|nr:FAD-dependent oxidoreductase [Pyrinomonadaceae bacterium]
MLTAEVVIIGGGVVGASVAYHLAARGVRDVLVLERGAAAGAGSTGRATGGFRAQFGTRVNVRLSLLSREKLLRFEEETGVDPGFRQAGYLFVAGNGEELRELVSAQAVQHECGLAEAREVDAGEVARLNPALSGEGVAGGVYCPSDGFIRPLEILRGYTEAAARLGARFLYGVTAEGVRADEGGRVGTLLTSAGEVSAGAFVNAAGAWAGEVGRVLGVEIPVTPLRRQVAVTRPFDLLPEAMPMTIYAGDGFHLRVRDGRVLLLWPDDQRAADPFDTSVDEGWLTTVVSKAHARVPCLRRAEIDRAACWAGLYEMSPDRHAILGLAEGFDNLYLVNGSSGHGVMHAPALGQLLAEIILDGHAHTLDVQVLRPSRFAEGEPNVGPSLL